MDRRPPKYNSHPRPQAHRRDVAMKRDRNSYGDERRDRERGRGDRDHRAPAFSPSRVRSRSRSRSPATQQPRGYRENDPSKSRRNKPQSVQPNTEHTRHRSRDRRETSLESRARRPQDEGRGRGRGRDIAPPQNQHHSRDRDRSPEHAQRRPQSPSSAAKRTRSQSPYPPTGPKRKRHKRNRSRHRESRGPRTHEVSQPGRRSPATEYRGRGPVSQKQEEDLGSVNSRRRSLSPQHKDRTYHSRQPLSPLRRNSPPRYRSRSPVHISRRSSFSRQESPRHPGRTLPIQSDTASFSRRSSPSFGPPRGYPPVSTRSPRDHEESGPRNKASRRNSGRPTGRAQPASGANSIEVNMSRRGDYRGNHGPHMPSAYPPKGHFNDARYGHSPPHVNSGSSYHGSPTSQSPYGGGRGGWVSSHQYSPQQQYPHQYQQGNYGPPSGPAAGFHSSQSPPYPPTGPMQQQSFPQGRGFSRGGFRGGNHSSRGGPRGGGGFKNSQWNSTSQPPSARGSFSQSGENTPQHNGSQYAASNHSHTSPAREGGDDGENPFRPPKDLQVDDRTTTENNEDEPMPPPTNRPPSSAPTGPQSSKFSFAFKATSKAPVTAPKPEISQKFSAGPQRKDPPPQTQQQRQQEDDRDRRDLPRDVPTAPASSRGPRLDYRHGRQGQNTPRTRKVKKIMKRLKPKPQLPAELISSNSVFFRKPGNESVVGSGTYGKVFKGLHVYTKRLVALKKIRMEGERDGFPVTAVREIKLLQSLKHINIVKLQEVMVEKNDCFMVFEYLSHDLTGLLNHPTFKLDAAQKKHLAKQMFEGLDYLHKRGVLHRDIKAANILVSSDGILKLADFGLARFYAKRHQLDYTNRVITIWYRSPELLLGETQYHAAVDIWSAACVLVEIFTKHAIFPGDGGEISQLDKIYAILGTPHRSEWPGLTDMPWFELLRPGYRKPNIFAERYKDRVTSAAFDLLAAMFQYDPAKRPSATDVLEHPYFTTEEPAPRQAIELSNIQGDWHEFESKALRREKEKQEREARRGAANKESGHREKDRKRPSEPQDSQREPKRAHLEGRPAMPSKATSD